MSRRPWIALAFLSFLSTASFAATAHAEKATKRPSPRLVSVDVEGDLSESRVEKIAKKSMPRMRPCFSKVAKGDSRSPGSLQLRLLVMPSGKVIGATTERPIGSHLKLRRCIQNKVMDIRFPRSKRKAYTTVRLVLDDGSGNVLLRLIGARGAKGVLMGGGGSGNSIFGSGGGVSNFGIKGAGGMGVVGRLNSKVPGKARPIRMTLGPNPSIQGSMDRGVLRRVVRRHVNQVRYCYEQGLRRNPSLAGRVSVELVINPAGVVSTAQVRSSTLGDVQVEQCIVSAVRRIRFPARGGTGTVRVTYPFTFRTGP